MATENKLDKLPSSSELADAFDLLKNEASDEADQRAVFLQSTNSDRMKDTKYKVLCDNADWFRSVAMAARKGNLLVRWTTQDDL